MDLARLVDLLVPAGYPICLMIVVVGLGIIVRGRWRLAYFFPAYLGLILGQLVLVGLWPERFFNAATFMLIQSVLDITKLGLVLEVAWRTFRVFPGAARRILCVSVAVPLAVTLAATSIPNAIGGWTSYETAIGLFHPIVLDGTIWLIVIVLAAAMWYRVPVHPFHAAVLIGLALYMASYGTLLRVIVLVGLDDNRLYGSVLDRSAFLLLTSWWTYVAWRPDRTPDTSHAAVMQKLALRTTPTMS